MLKYVAIGLGVVVVGAAAFRAYQAQRNGVEIGRALTSPLVPIVSLRRTFTATGARRPLSVVEQTDIMRNPATRTGAKHF